MATGDVTGFDKNFSRRKFIKTVTISAATLGASGVVPTLSKRINDDRRLHTLSGLQQAIPADSKNRGA